jgi:uncharacterized membrane protein
MLVHICMHIQSSNPFNWIRIQLVAHHIQVMAIHFEMVSRCIYTQISFNHTLNVFPILPITILVFLSKPSHRKSISHQHQHQRFPQNYRHLLCHERTISWQWLTLPIVTAMVLVLVMIVSVATTIATSIAISAILILIIPITSATHRRHIPAW